MKGGAESEETVRGLLVRIWFLVRVLRKLHLGLFRSYILPIGMRPVASDRKVY